MNRVSYGLDVDIRIDVPQPVACRVDLRAADAGRSVEDLPLQVREIDDIELDEPERADARRRKIERHGRAQSARTDQQHTRFLERALPSLPTWGRRMWRL